MIKALGLLLAAVLAGIALLHFYWAAGGGFGGGSAVPTVGGKRTFEPSTFATVMVGLAFVLAVLVVLGRMGYLGQFLPAWVFRVGALGIGLIFLARAIGDFRMVGFFKQASPSSFAFWDNWVYSPLCLGIAIVALVVAIRD
ncbi:MAG: DUF3995 domain-containing protein [Pyrinomonadaceae bacterium]